MTDWNFIIRKQLKRLRKKHPEPEVWDAIRKIRGHNFIDVGANRGLVYTLPLHHNFSRTYAIEPNPRLAEWLRREIERRRIDNYGWGAVEVDEWAASDENGGTTLFVDGYPLAGSSTIKKDQYEKISPIHNGKWKPLEVRTRRLDDWWGTATVKLLKIDVEGAELDVLAGAERVLGLTQNCVVESHSKAEMPQLVVAMRNAFPEVSWIHETHILGRR